MRDFYMGQARALEIEAETGITVRQQAEMPLDEWSRLAYGQTPAQAAMSALYGQDDPGNPANPAAAGPNQPQTGDSTSQTYDAPTVAHEAAPGLSLEEYALQSPEGFAEWRSQRGNQGEGVGIFASVGSQSQAYRDAAARHTGRTAFGREQHHPGVPRQFPRNDVPPAGRKSYYR